MEEVQRAYRLAQVRKSQARTQVEIADAMGVSQARVSDIERGDMSHTELGTLAAYVRAVGGHLRVIAEFDNGDRCALSNDIGPRAPHTATCARHCSAGVPRAAKRLSISEDRGLKAPITPPKAEPTTKAGPAPVLERQSEGAQRLSAGVKNRG
ncbi:MAG: helix-turn-helix transcriptional regulator, partial [Nocardia sp.]|nr:helix-turn-helix transcriptional regulator [Nocardia sp.]